MTAKTRKQYSDELKREAVALVVEQGLSVKEAAQQIGVPANYISRWKQRFLTADGTLLSCEERRELEELRKENKRCQPRSLRYAFIRQQHADNPEYTVSILCQMLKVSTSGYYDWWKGEAAREARTQK